MVFGNLDCQLLLFFRGSHLLGITLLDELLLMLPYMVSYPNFGYINSFFFFCLSFNQTIPFMLILVFLSNCDFNFINKYTILIHFYLNTIDTLKDLHNFKIHLPNANTNFSFSLSFVTNMLACPVLAKQMVTPS